MTEQERVELLHPNKMGLTFHRTFTLVRPAVSAVLQLAIETSKGDTRHADLTRERIREDTNLGTIYVEAMPRYAIAVGLLDESFKPTLLGNHAFHMDPLLEWESTQWLMHYHISTTYGVGPAFWNHLVTKRFRSGSEFTTDEVAQEIADYVGSQEDRNVSDRDAKSTARVFLGSYTKSDALSNLGILESIDDKTYRVLEPDSPSSWVFAYAVLHYWDMAFRDQLTINLNSLTGQDGLTSLFLTSAGRLSSALREMQEEGYVEVHRVAPPYQVVLLNSDRGSVLERIYHHE